MTMKPPFLNLKHIPALILDKQSNIKLCKKNKKPRLCI